MLAEKVPLPRLSLKEGRAGRGLGGGRSSRAFPWGPEEEDGLGRRPPGDQEGFSGAGAGSSDAGSLCRRCG